MAELLKNGAVFIHVPKCGGAWVRAVIRALRLHRDRVGSHHATPQHINDVWKYHRLQFIKHWPLHPWVTPGKLRRAFKFAFVRHPLTWYESWWKFMAGNWHPWEPGRWHPQRPIDDCGDDDFNRFLANVLEHRPGYVSEMYGWYTEGVDFVGKCENLANDLIEALGRTGATFDPSVIHAFKRVNVSRAGRGKPYWDRQLLQRIVESEAAGIERFGYSMAVEDVVDVA